MLLPMASCLVGIDQAEVRTEGEHHGSGATTVDGVVVAVERICAGFHAAGLGALRAMGHGHGAVLGRAYPHSNLDRRRSGVALARAGALCRVRRLGSRGGRTSNLPLDRPRTASPMGSVSSGRRR